MKESINELKEIRSKRILNYMHQKSFFQGVTSCFISGRCKVDKNLTLPTIASKEAPVNHKKLAKNLLKCCGIIRRKHYRASDVLKQGEGRLCFTGGITFKEMLQNLSSLLSNRKSKNTLGDA